MKIVRFFFRFLKIAVQQYNILIKLVKVQIFYNTIVI